MPGHETEESFQRGEQLSSNIDEETFYTIRPVPFGWIVLVTAFCSYLIFGGLLTWLAIGVYDPAEVIPARFVTVASQIVFLLLPALLLVRLQPWSYAKLLSLKPPDAHQTLLAAATVLLLYLPLTGIMTVQDYLVSLSPEWVTEGYAGYKNSISELYSGFATAHTPGELVAVLLVIAVTPALCEELLFRGVALGAFRKGTGTKTAVFVTAVVFALFHLNPVTFLPLTILGMVFGWMVIKTGSVVPAIIAHFANNTIAVISLYFHRGADIAFEPAFDKTNALIYLAASIVSLIVLITLWSRYLSASRLSQKSE